MFQTHDLLNNLEASLLLFLPELVLCAGIILFLLLRLFKALDQVHLGYAAFAVTAIALAMSWYLWQEVEDMSGPLSPVIFSGLVAFDGLAVFLKLLLCGFVLLLIWLSLLTGIPDHEDSADFYVLLLGATLGMMLMASANHLLMVYIAVEMASLPSYALAGYLKGRRQSSEASLKYVVYGGAASGVMLYGISLLAGRFGTGYLPDLARCVVAVLEAGGFDAMLMIGLMLILVGLAFKLSAVPFHFWCPDVFEGAAAEVAAFLSIASKGAAIALAGRFTLAFVSVDGDAWQTVTLYLGPALAFLAAITATFGNLAAYAQTNLKRLLAYSTIAHAGYMLMSLATLNRDGLDGALFYLLAYLFMNLGAFAVVAFIRNQTGSEDLSGYSGMIQRAPLLTVVFAIFLLSLVGLPPLMGYMAKFQVFAAMYKSAQNYENNGLYVLLVIGLINTVISLVYYVRVLKVMIIDSPAADVAGQRLQVPRAQQAYAGLLAVVVLVGMLFWDPLAKDGSGKGVQQFPLPEPVKMANKNLQVAKP
jgi:NADH-quinone oxidoreductase subunit N